MKKKAYLLWRKVLNNQNDKVYAHSSQEASELVPRVGKGHHPASLMGVLWRFYISERKVPEATEKISCKVS